MFAELQYWATTPSNRPKLNFYTCLFRKVFGAIISSDIYKYERNVLVSFKLYSVILNLRFMCLFTVEASGVSYYAFG